MSDKTKVMMVRKFLADWSGRFLARSATLRSLGTRRREKTAASSPFAETSDAAPGVYAAKARPPRSVAERRVRASGASEDIPPFTGHRDGRNDWRRPPGAGRNPQ